MILGAIADAGGALVSISCFIVCVVLDSLIFLLVLSEVELFSFLFVLSVVTFESDVLSFLLTFVLFDVELFTFAFFLLSFLLSRHFSISLTHYSISYLYSYLLELIIEFFICVYFNTISPMFKSVIIPFLPM